MSRWKPYLPWIFAGIGVLVFLGAMAPRSEPATEMQLSKFGKILVLDEGRLKPVDTVARVSLMVMNRRQTYYDEHNTRQEAIRWLLNLMAEGIIRSEGTVVIDEPKVLTWLGLPEKEVGQFNVGQVRQAFRQKAEKFQQLAQIPEGQWDPLQKQIMEVARAVMERQRFIEEASKVQQKQGDPEKARIFRIDNDQVLAMLGLERREGLRYSQEEILNRDKPEYFNQFMQKALAAKKRPEKQRDLIDMKTLELFGNLRTQTALMNLDGLLIIPGSSLDDWNPIRHSMMNGDNPKDTGSLANILTAYALGDAKNFNKEVDNYLARQAKAYPAETRTGRLEAWFNHFAPFYQCANLYVLALLLAILSWVVWPAEMRQSAFWLCVVVLAVHSFALCLRMYIQARPPVINLYSSAVFIGWGCVLLCLYVEGLFRNGIGNAVAATLGFATMIIAHHLGGSGDTLETMQAVLDTNFWLATHVTTVTLGYTATFVAGFFAIVLIYRMHASTVRHVYADRKQLTTGQAAAFIAVVVGVVALPALVIIGVIFGLWALWMQGEPLSLGIGVVLVAPILIASAGCGGLLINRRFTPGAAPPQLLATVEQQALTAESSRTLTSMIYGVVCFATLLSFVGTVLGGIWADQSWGRFWGWDPKENGAILIVVMNALILHARWGGMIKERGMACLTLVGNMITAWSWFGTNQLGVGLHAYGFNSTLADGCALFWVSQLALIGLGLLPLRYYRLYAPAASAAPAPAGKVAMISDKRGKTSVMPASS